MSAVELGELNKGDFKSDGGRQVDVQMEPGVDDVKKTLSGGVQLTKHAAGKSLSDKRIVFYHETGGKGYLAWQLVANTRTYDAKRSVALNSINAIFLGKQTEAFTRRHAANVSDDCAFSIQTDKRTLDLEADSRKSRDAFLKNLKILLNAFEVQWKLHASPNSKEGDEKEIMEKRGAPVKFQVHVRCKNLPRRLDAAELDSVCLGFEKFESTGRLIYLAQTDVIKENDSPAYGSALILPYYAGAKQMLKIAAYAVDGSQLAEDQQIGYVQVPFSTLVDGPGLGEEMPFSLKSNDPVKNKKLQELKSQMFLTCTPALLSEAELLAKMQRIFMAGDSFYLYHSKHPASRVLVFFRKATHDKPDMLYWCRDNTVDKNGKDTKEKPRCVEFADCCMPLLSITDVYLGRQTAAFERPPANKAPSDRCFSFKSSHQNRVLELQAKSQQVRDAWVFGLMALIRQAQNVANRAGDRKAGGGSRLQLHNEPPAPRRTPIPHSHNFKCTLAVSARNLPEAVDPLVGVFLKQNGRLKFVEHTETLMDKSNPVYSKRVVVDYGGPAGASDDVRLTVYNVETPQIKEKDTIGFATVSVTQLLDSQGRELILPLQNPRNKSLNRVLSERKAVVVIRNLQALPSGTIELKCSCRGMISADGNPMGAKNWVLVAYESMGASADSKGLEEKTRVASPTVTTKAGKATSVSVKYTGQTECLRDSSTGAADFKRSVGPFEYRGGDSKIVKLAVYVVKDDTVAAGVKDFNEKQQEADRIGSVFINLDNLMISGEPTVTYHFTNPENRGREMRLKAEDAHVMVTYSFRPSAASATGAGAAVSATGSDSKDSGSLTRTGALPSGGTVSAAALTAALANQGNAVGTVSLPAIIKKLQGKMGAGRSFIQYTTTAAPAKISVFYREDAKTGGTLYWAAAGAPQVPDPKQSIALSAVTHVYLGKQLPPLQTAQAPSDTLFSVCTATTQLHLQSNSAKTRDQWVYGLMGVLQAFNSSAKLHAETGAPGGPAGTLKAGNSPTAASPMNTAKSALAVAKGSEIAIALNLPSLPLSTQKMLAVMFGGKKFIRYPFGAADSTATVSKIFFRAAGARLGTLYYADPNSNTDAADLNALAAAGAALPIHTVTEITVGNGAHPAPPTGTTVQPANCLSFVAGGQSLHLEAKDAKQALLWAKTIQSLMQTGGVNVKLNEPAEAPASS